MTPFCRGTLSALLLLSLAAPAWPGDLTGEELATRLGCRACHRWQGTGGTRAPSLEGVGTRRSRQELEQQLTRSSGRRMPSFAFLRPQEWQALLTFLEGL